MTQRPDHLAHGEPTTDAATSLRAVPKTLSDILEEIHGEGIAHLVRVTEAVADDVRQPSAALPDPHTGEDYETVRRALAEARDTPITPDDEATSLTEMTAMKLSATMLASEAPPVAQPLLDRLRAAAAHVAEARARSVDLCRGLTGVPLDRDMKPQPVASSFMDEAERLLMDIVDDSNTIGDCTSTIARNITGG